MARYTFGGSVYGGLASPFTLADARKSTDAGTVTTVANVLQLNTSTPISFSLAEGGAATTDLLVWNGTAYVAATNVAPTSDGVLPRFQGPDGAAELWTQTSGGTWLRIAANDYYPGGGGGGSATWGSITGQPAVIAAGPTADAARQAINAASLDDVTSAVSGVTSGLASDSGVVHKASAETITGVKTFSAAPIVPDNSFDVDAIAGLNAAMDAAAQARVSEMIVYYSGSTLPSTVGRRAPAIAVQVAAALVPSMSDLYASLPTVAAAGSASTFTLSRANTTGTWLFEVFVANLSAAGPLPTAHSTTGITYADGGSKASGNSNNMLKVYRGTGTATSTTESITYATAPTSIVAKVMEVANLNSTPLQTATPVALSVTQPSISFTSAVTTGSYTIAVLAHQQPSATINVPAGFNEIGSRVAYNNPPVVSLVVAIGPTPSNGIIQWNAGATAPTGATAAQKVLMAYEHSAATA